MTGCWNGKVAGYRLNILIFMLFILIFNIIFVMRTCIVKAQLKCPLSSSIKMTTLISHSLY
ncbi:TPA: hypothetical protein MIU44_13040 [Klebsiella pneumoniae]|nr:hypothetical protein [Klebsiella pneumoniae]